MTASNRGLLLYRLADAIAADAERLADLEVRDNRKLRVKMLGQMRYLIGWRPPCRAIKRCDQARVLSLSAQ